MLQLLSLFCRSERKEGSLKKETRKDQVQHPFVTGKQGDKKYGGITLCKNKPTPLIEANGKTSA